MIRSPRGSRAIAPWRRPVRRGGGSEARLPRQQQSTGTDAGGVAGEEASEWATRACAERAGALYRHAGARRAALAARWVHTRDPRLVSGQEWWWGGGSWVGPPGVPERQT
jgi:hypothetical protein